MQILLIEDDPIISWELQLRWKQLGWAVQVCERLDRATEVVVGLTPDLLVLDLSLPDGDGLLWLQQWRKGDPRTPVLVLTARDQVADRVAGLKAGADDYLVKPFSVEELDARMEALLRRSVASRTRRAQLGRLSWLPDEGMVSCDGRPLDLNPREFEVLGLLIQRAPRLVPKRVLLDALAERNLEVGDSAIEVYVSRLRKKLLDCQVRIETSRGFGYRLVLDAGPEQGLA